MISLLASLMLAAAAPAAVERPKPAARPRLVVLDFQVHGAANPALGRALADVAAAEADAIGGLQVVTQAELSSIIGLEQTRQLLGCDDRAACLVELAGALNTERLLSGENSAIGKTVLLVVRIVDLRRTKTLARASQSLSDPSEPEQFDAVRRLTHEALTGEKMDTAGLLRVEASEDGAQVSVDGHTVGTTPNLLPLRLAEGRHEVRVARPGFITAISPVVVRRGSSERLDVHLMPLPDNANLGRLTGWTSLAAGAAGVTLGAVALWQESSASRNYRAAKAMLRSDGALPADADAQAYSNAVAAGDRAHGVAIGTGIGAGVAVASSVILGWIAYRQTGAIGPIRF